MIEKLRLTQIFSDQYNLSNINLVLYKQEIAGIVVRSRSSRKGVFKLLSGEADPSYGTLYTDGKEEGFSNKEEARRKGVGSVSENSQLIPNLNLYENLFIATKGRYFQRLLPRRVYISETSRLLKEAGLAHLSPLTKAWSLTLAEGHIIEIIKAFTMQTKVLILDGVTDIYTPLELRRLTKYLAQRRDEGMSILYLITHNNSLFEITDRLIIIRGGTTVATLDSKPFSKEHLSYYFEELCSTTKKKEPLQNKKQAVKLLNFLPEGETQPMSLTVHKGEVVGVIEREWNRGTAVGQALSGIVDYSGDIKLLEKTIVIKNNRHSISQGIAYIEANENRAPLFYNMGLNENIAMLLKKEYVYPHGLLNARMRKYKVDEAIRALGFEDLRVKYGEDEPLIATTHTDRMRITLARSYCVDPKLLVIVNPHISLEEMVLADFQRIMQCFCNIGAGVLLFSTNRHNLMEVYDRVLEESEI